MNKLVIVLLLALVALVAAKSHFDKDTLQKFADFQVKYNKSYKSDQEEIMRLKIFQQNLLRIEKMNLQSEGNTNFGVTKFADLTPSEFSHLYLMPKRPIPFRKGKAMPESEIPDGDVPAEWDWRKDGLINGQSAISPVNNQGQCGSCWAFSATEEIESMNFLQRTGEHNGKPWELAVQQIVDCDKTAYGCQGGWTYAAYEYVEKAGGLEALSDYPYTAQNGRCKFDKRDVKEDISKWQYVTTDKNENVMKKFIGTTGPASICVDAQPWQFYEGGVLTARNCGNQIDHCVQLVGYKKVNNKEAWIVRNSWGTNWGEEGYIYLEYGTNTCACADVVTTVTGKKL